VIINWNWNDLHTLGTMISAESSFQLVGNGIEAIEAKYAAFFQIC
jgi:hypothetical protein